MKNLFLIFLIFFCLFSTNAQTDSTSHVKKWSVTIMPSVGLGYLMSNKTTKNTDSMGFHRQAIGSYGIGLSLNYKFKKRITLNIGVQYLLNGYFKFTPALAILLPSPNTGNELDHYTRINHLNIPISADFGLSRNNKFKCGLGAFVGFTLSTRTKIDYFDNTPSLDKNNYETFNTDFGISNSVSYSFRLSSAIEMPIKANYNLGIKNISITNEKLKTSNFQLGLGLRLLL